MSNRAEKILIVDDVSKNIQILGNILSLKDFQIAYAQSGKQALEVSKIQSFDLILLDIMMPEMDGYEVCKKLKSDSATSDIPIIFLTAKADMESIIKGFEVGGQDYITKPFNASELLVRVNTHLTIKKQQKLLKEMNTNLEELVSERTCDLKIANQKLSRLDKAKSSFLSLISHEIRTPLNGVIGITELLSRTDLSDYQKEQVDSLKEVSARLVKFSNTALLITTLKTYDHYASMLATPLSVLVEESVDKFNAENPDTSIKINMLGVDRNVRVNVDNELITKCFYFIIDNVHRFAGEGSELTISSECNDGVVALKFSDNGLGFSEEALENIFDVFSTGDLMHSEGSGLGLAASKLIIDAHLGEIIVKNNESGGADVTIELKYHKD